VGKLSTDRLKIGHDEEEDTEAVSSQKQETAHVGKLNENRYELTSELVESEKCDDTHIVPTGKVSKSASAFLTTNTSSADLSPKNKTKKSRSGNVDAAAEMQRKYEEQLAASQKAKDKKSQSFRMKSRDDTVIKKDRSAINKSLKRAETFVAQSTRTSVFSNSYQEEEATHNKIERRESVEEREEETSRVSVQEAKQKFFQSLQQSNTEKTSKVQKMGTSILPAVGQSRGKALFNKCAESNDDTDITETKEQPKLIPGVDFEEIEDEFDRLHREMMGEE